MSVFNPMPKKTQVQLKAEFDKLDKKLRNNVKKDTANNARRNVKMKELYGAYISDTKELWRDRAYPVCWKCWISLTDKSLRIRFKGTYSDSVAHDVRCPMCGYGSWKGRRWYPLSYLGDLMKEIGNPTSLPEEDKGNIESSRHVSLIDWETRISRRIYTINKVFEEENKYL